MYLDLIHKTWHTQVNGQTDTNGRYTVRGFNGDYEVVVKQGSAQIIRQTTLTVKGQTLVVNVTHQ